MPDGVLPIQRGVQAVEFFNLDRRMGDDVQKLLMAPDIVFQRSDVEITDGDEFLRFGVIVLEPPVQLIDKIELVREFVVVFGVWNIAACGNVNIVKVDAAHRHGDMAAILTPDTMMDIFFGERDFREDRDTVIGLHAVEMLVRVAFVFEDVRGKMLIRTFCFLQTDNIGLQSPHHIQNDGRTQTNGVYVPGEEFHG